MNIQRHQHINGRKEQRIPDRKLLMGGLGGFLVLVLFAGISSAQSGQSTDSLIAHFQEQDIPVEAVRTEGETVIAEVGLSVDDDLGPQNMERMNAAIFLKLAESYPDSSVLRAEYSMEGEVFNSIEIDTRDVFALGAPGPAGAAMLARARMTVTPSAQERVTSELEAVQEQEAAIEVSSESSLPERTVPLPDEAEYLGGSGGGGGGGVVVSPAGSSNTLIILFFVLAGCLILAIAILVVRRRTGAPQAVAASLNIRASLKVTYQDGGTKVYQIQKERTAIGRDPSNDLVLHDTDVSARHAEIVVSGGNFVLRDLGSTNGTKLNGKTITESPVYLGNEIILGTTKLILDA